MSLRAIAKKEAAKRGLYSRFFRGPVLGPDNVETMVIKTEDSGPVFVEGSARNRHKGEGTRSERNSAPERKEKKKRKVEERSGEDEGERKARKKRKRERKEAEMMERREAEKKVQRMRLETRKDRVDHMDRAECFSQDAPLRLTKAEGSKGRKKKTVKNGEIPVDKGQKPLETGDEAHQHTDS
jgi:hypothetical protein